MTKCAIKNTFNLFKRQGMKKNFRTHQKPGLKRQSASLIGTPVIPIPPSPDMIVPPK